MARAIREQVTSLRVTFPSLLGTVLSRRLGTCDLLDGSVARRMKKIDYNGYRFPPVIIQQAVWLYFQFTFSSAMLKVC